MKTTFTLGLLAAFALSVPALADPLIGVWQTEPDKKNLTSHIQVRQCGSGFCGKILKAFDPSGAEVQTPNVGKPLFWDMQAAGPGAYEGGTFYIPLMDLTVKGKMKLNGNTVTVRGCKGPVCDGQTWKRVR